MEQNELLQQVREKAGKWLNSQLDDRTRQTITYLLDHDENELIESFYKDLEFGTGGLRGIMGVGSNRMNIYTVGMATQGLCNYLLRQFQGKDHISVAIAHDSRNNSRLFAETAAKICIANGIRAYLFDDLRPTPELSFAIRHLGCQSGIVITASHNPKEYNGYKVYWEDGGQIIEPHDVSIIEEVQKITSFDQVKWDGDPAKIRIIGSEIDEIYTDRIKGLSLNPELIRAHSDLRIVYTPIHGSGVRLVPMVLKKLGFSNIFSVPEQDVTDGNFPTVISPNPEESAALTLALKKADEAGADLVMATDPDADRVGIAVRDHQGKLILLNGNQTASILFYYLLSQWSARGKLTGKEYIVKTIVTTELLTEIADRFGVEHFDVLTGFKYIADIMKQKEGKMTFIVGGEESYGYLAGDFVRDKDAVMSCALIAETAAWAKSRGKNLYDVLLDIYKDFSLYREGLISVVRKGKSGAEEIRRMMEDFRNSPPDSIHGSDVVMVHDFEMQKSYDNISHLRYDITLPKSNVLQFVLKDGSKISVRPSGTEPKIKFYFSVRDRIREGETLEAAEARLGEKIHEIQKELKLV
ncbi:MAG: phospho-sugar mutase [Bacteroidota bacterium]